MTASSSPASSDLHRPVLVSLRSALHEALDFASATADNAIDHQRHISARKAHELLQLTHHIQRHILAAACLDLSDRS